MCVSKRERESEKTDSVMGVISGRTYISFAKFFPKIFCSSINV